MRKGFVNTFTFYMAAGALFNIVATLVIISLDTSLFESVATLFMTDLCYVSIARMIWQKQERIASNRNWKPYRLSGVGLRRG